MKGNRMLREVKEIEREKMEGKELKRENRPVFVIENYKEGSG